MLDTTRGAGQRRRRQLRFLSYETVPAPPSLIELCFCRLIGLIAANTKGDKIFNGQELRYLPPDISQYVAEELVATGNLEAVREAPIIRIADLRKVENISPDVIRMLLPHEIEEINMTECSVNTAIFRALAEVRPKRLILNNIRISNFSTDSLTNFHSVEEVQSSSVTSIPSVMSVFLNGSFASLRKLDMSACGCIMTHWLSATVPPLLEELRLADNSFDDIIFTHLMPVASSLRVLDLSNCQLRNNHGLFALLRCFRKLEVLGLNSNTSVDDTVLQVLYRPSVEMSYLGQPDMGPITATVLGVYHTDIKAITLERLCPPTTVIAAGYSLSQLITTMKHFGQMPRFVSELFAFTCINFAVHPPVMEHEFHRSKAPAWTEISRSFWNEKMSEVDCRWSGFATLVMDLMEQHSSVAEVQTNAMAILHALTKDRLYVMMDSIRDRLLVILLNIIHDHPTDKQLQENACITLCNFHNPTEFERFSKGIARALLNSASTFSGSGSSNILLCVAHLMVGLSALPKHHKEIMGGLRTMEQFVDLLNKTRDSNRIQVLGWASVWNITDSCVINCESLLDCGGLSALLGVMSAISLENAEAEASTQQLYLPRSLLGVLGNVAECVSCRARLLDKPNDFSTILKQLRRCLDADLETQYLAGCAIVNLIQVESSPGPTKTLVDYTSPLVSMDSLIYDDQSLVQVSRLADLSDELRKLDLVTLLHKRIVSWPISLNISVEYSCLGPMIALAQSRHPTTRLYAAYALTNMTFKNDKHRDLLWSRSSNDEYTGIEMLHQLANDTEAQISDISVKGLQRLKEYRIV